MSIYPDVFTSLALVGCMDEDGPIRSIYEDPPLAPNYESSIADTTKIVCPVQDRTKGIIDIEEFERDLALEVIKSFEVQLAGYFMSNVNSDYMRSWTKCFRTKHVGVTMAHFVDHFSAYHKWFSYESLIMPGRRISWDSD